MKCSILKLKNHYQGIIFKEVSEITIIEFQVPILLEVHQKEYLKNKLDIIMGNK